MKRKNWIKLLNKKGKKREACYFFINFTGDTAMVFSREELKENNIYCNFEGIEPYPLQLKTTIPQSLYPQKIGFNRYKKSFDIVAQHLHRGDSYLVNLSMPTPLTKNVNLAQCYAQSQAKYKVLFRDKWLCFSPETFVKISNNQIKSYPMKGTIDANLPHAKEQIMADKKEMAEHYTIVDLLRNDLSTVAKKVQVSRFRYLDKIKKNNGEIYQVSSEITGEMPQNWQNKMGDILAQILPAGSISGAPKNKTMEIIKEAEDYNRGFYTGICGHFDGENLNTGVMIRFIEKIETHFYYKSGGGITAKSNLKNEYEEIQQKIYLPLG